MANRYPHLGHGAVPWTTDLTPQLDRALQRDVQTRRLRKREELEQERQLRKMAEVDAVGFVVDRNKKTQAEKIDEFYNYAAQIGKQSEGKPTMDQMLALQKRKNELRKFQENTLAEEKIFKDQYNAYTKDQGRTYDPIETEENFRHYMEGKGMPVGGMLVHKGTNPVEYFSSTKFRTGEESVKNKILQGDRFYEKESITSYPEDLGDPNLPGRTADYYKAATSDPLLVKGIQRYFRDNATQEQIAKAEEMSKESGRAVFIEWGAQVFPEMMQRDKEGRGVTDVRSRVKKKDDPKLLVKDVAEEIKTVKSRTGEAGEEQTEVIYTAPRTVEVQGGANVYRFDNDSKIIGGALDEEPIAGTTMPIIKREFKSLPIYTGEKEIKIYTGDPGKYGKEDRGEFILKPGEPIPDEIIEKGKIHTKDMPVLGFRWMGFEPETRTLTEKDFEYRPVQITTVGRKGETGKNAEVMNVLTTKRFNELNIPLEQIKEQDEQLYQDFLKVLEQQPEIVQAQEEVIEETPEGEIKTQTAKVEISDL